MQQIADPGHWEYDVKTQGLYNDWRKGIGECVEQHLWQQ